MNVLWISHLVPWPPLGGVLQRSFNLLREATRRHTVTLATLNQAAILPTRAEVEQASVELGKICREIHVCELPSNRSRLVWAGVAAASVATVGPYDENWLFSPRMHATVRGLLKSQPFDLIHLDTVGLFQYARSAGSTPIALTHHNIESDMMRIRAEQERSLPKRIYFGLQAGKLERLERRAAARARVNLTVSDLDGDRLRSIVPGSTCATIANGVDVEYFKPAAQADPPARSLVFVGGMTWYPNQDAMEFFGREIWPKLLESNPEWRASIVGRSPPAEIREAARSGRLVAPGFVDDARPYFDEAAIYVCPIRTGGGTRLKILDALAMAKPLVATAFAVEGLGMEAERDYLRAESPLDYVRQLERLAGDRALRARLASNARRIALERFSWEFIGQELDRAYRGAVASRATDRP